VLRSTARRRDPNAAAEVTDRCDITRRGAARTAVRAFAAAAMFKRPSGAVRR
jgi:hypothetical protein